MQHWAPCVGALAHSTHHATLSAQARFLGQLGEDVSTAERALKELRGIQSKETDLFSYNLNMQMRGVVLGPRQQQRVWANYFMTHSMPPDFVELCQIAATQQNRYRLFQEPFQQAALA